MKLDYVLGLKPEDFLERRLQTQVFKLGLAKSIHHSRVLIRQGHIRWGRMLNGSLDFGEAACLNILSLLVKIETGYVQSKYKMEAQFGID